MTAVLLLVGNSRFISSHFNTVSLLLNLRGLHTGEKKSIEISVYFVSRVSFFTHIESKVSKTLISEKHTFVTLLSKETH